MTRIGPDFSPLFLDPYAVPGLQPQGPGGPQSGAPTPFAFGPDAFARAAGLSPDAMSFITGARSGGMQLDPAMIFASLTGLQGQDAGVMQNQGPWGVQDAEALSGASREELEQAIKEMFEELNQAGFPLEARPGSELAEAMATGDFSNVNPEDLAALLYGAVDAHD